MSALAEYDGVRSYASRIVADSCARLDLVAPLPGLGVAITEATEQVFGACYSGTPIGAPAAAIVSAWSSAWPEHVPAILSMLQRIYDDLREQHS